MISVILVLSVLFATGQTALINDAKCGYRPLHNSDEVIADPLARIVGGNATKQGDHPWQVALLRNGAFQCGGSLIDEYTVLSAAHCTTLTNPALYTIVRTWSRSPLDSWAQSRKVVRLVNHPSYSSSTYNNDISLLFVSEPFDFGPNEVGHICVAKDDPVEDERAIATGWGHLASGGTTQNILREAYMPITRLDAIRVQYGSAYNPVTMIGAAYQGDGLDTCQNDSGGPLSVQSKSRLDRLEQVGIVSWGYGCGGIGLYTRVSTYFQWIIDQNKEFLRSIGKANQ